MITIHINRHELANGLCDIERMVANAIKQDLKVKKVTADCITNKWQGHTCPEFKIKADGVKMVAYGDIDPIDLELDPWKYDMTIHYHFLD